MRQNVRIAWYFLVLALLVGVWFAHGRADEKKTEPEGGFPAVAWIEAQENADVNKIEVKLEQKEAAEQQLSDPGNPDKGTLKERFAGAVLVGDSVATGFLDYESLDATEIVALRGLRTDSAGPEIEKALSLAPKVLFLSIGLNDLEYCRGDSRLFIRHYEERLTEIRAQAPDLPVYINGILPVLPEAVEKKPALQNVDTFNQALRDMCKKWNLTYIDNSELLQDHADWYQKDAVHLKSTPYPLWLERMEEAAGL